MALSFKMHIPTFQSLVCLSLLTAPYVSAFPLDENLQPRAATTCNANDVKTVKNSNKQPVPYCKSWLSSKHSTSTVKGLSVAQVSNACKCIQASASSSSVAAAKKTTSSAKKASSTKKVTSSTKKISSSTKKATTSVKKTTFKQALVVTKASSSSSKSSSTKKSSTSSQKTSSKPTSTLVQSTSKKTSSTALRSSTSTLKTIARSTSVTSEKSTWTPVSTKQSSSSSSKISSSSTSGRSTASSSSSTHSTISTSSTITSSATGSSSSAVVSGTLSSAFSSAVAIPTDPTSDVVANQKAPTSVSTRSASDSQTSTSNAVSSETSSPSTNSNTASTGSNIITNGNFNGGSTNGWHGARAYGTKFSVASLAGDSNYEALVKYALAANDNASGQLYQNISIPANSAWQLNADVYLNYPSGLPAGVSCVVKYSLGSDSIILKQYGAVSTSGAVLSDTASGQLSQAFTGRFQIDTYCNSASSSAASFALGFGNIQLLVSDAGSAAATSAAATSAAARVASTTASSPSTTSSAAGGSATANNMLTNGNFGTGDFSGWALYRLGNPTFAIQGDPNAYVSVIKFPAGGDSNSQAALLQQPASVQAGKTYNLSMGLLLNYPSGLPADGATCSLQVYLVDSNGFGILFAQTKYGNGDAAFQSIAGTGTVNSGFDGNFNIMLRCYGSASAIVTGIEDVVVSES
ncbi:hypothetical protein D6D23_01057 [Aureobasidium pullulans]|nr:hypothetical protein D6D23_01057 [Aureobasidium pullulans]